MTAVPLWFVSVVVPACAVEDRGATEQTSTADLSAATSELVVDIGAGQQLQRYLALGDSIAFGYNPVAAATTPTTISAFVGYPELVAPPNFGANAACPGETSASFIDPTAPDDGCHEWRAAGFAMHVDYASLAQSQLQFALSYLAAHPETTTVSLHIGVNELRLLQEGCIAAHPTDPNAIAQCIAEGGPAVIAAVAQRVGYILGAIRQSGYAKKLIVVTYYELDYSNPADVAYQGILGLDRALVQVAQTPGLNAWIARAFTAFEQVAASAGGDSCAAGLLFRLPDGSCDIHPSALGRLVLAHTVLSAAPASTIDLSAPNARF